METTYIYNLIIISRNEDDEIILDTHSYVCLETAKRVFEEICGKWKEGILSEFSAISQLDKGYGYVRFTNGRHMFLRKEPLIAPAVPNTETKGNSMDMEQALRLADDLGLIVTFSSSRKVSDISNDSVLIEEKDGSCIAYESRDEFLEYMAWRKEQGV